jgi:FOG: Ankyrin repeat
MLAAAFGQDEMVGLLLEAGSNPNATEPDGMTALDFAIDQGHAAVAERLWAAGAVSGKHGPAAEPQRIPRGIDRPDFSDGSRDPGFQESALRLSEICGTPAEPFDELGGVTCVVPKGRASEIVDAHRQEFLHRGCFLFHTRAASFARANPCQIVLLPTTDQFAAIALLQTNGINYDLGPGDIIDALKEIDREWPLILTEVSHDLVSGRFMEPLGNTPALARRLYELCPDIVDQGTESLSALAAALKQSPDLFLWWD